MKRISRDLFVALYYQFQDRADKLSRQSFDEGKPLLDYRFFSGSRWTCVYSTLKEAGAEGFHVVWKLGVKQLEHFLAFPCNDGNLGRIESGETAECLCRMRWFGLFYVYYHGFHPIGKCPWKKPLKWWSKRKTTAE